MQITKGEGVTEERAEKVRPFDGVKEKDGDGIANNH